MLSVWKPINQCNSRSLLWHLQKRFRNKNAKKNQRKVTNTDRAQEYFDKAYPVLYGARWPSVRLALLSKQKYVALINNFANHEETLEKFQELGAMDIRHKYAHRVERMKTTTPATSSETDSSESEEDHENEANLPIRPSLVELSDDEIVARQNQQPLMRYPEEYRLRAEAKGSDVGYLEPSDFANRIISPSEGGMGGASMMDYVPATKLKGMEDWMEETDVFQEVSKGDVDIGVKTEVQQEPINLPEMLKIYSFDKGDISDFPRPRMDRELKVLDHYCLDAGSLLPVLALDIGPGHSVLDLCAAPGGKSLLALQTLLPGMVVSNDKTESRVKRIKEVMKQYIPEGLSSIHNSSLITQVDGSRLMEKDSYDRVLVDVPCLTDRHALQEDDNSIFKNSRTKERLKMPELQSYLLFKALQAVRPGGCVVYSTCTLSPLQNDGAVHLALSRIWQETSIECSVVDMSTAIRPLAFLYRFGSNLGLRYGQLVLPSLLSNFGPTYFAKIKRLK